MSRVKLSRHLVVAGAKLVVFTVVSLIVTGTLVVIMGKFGTGETKEYSAVFTNASLIQKGDDVRVAGVIVGKVREVEIVQTDKAKVDFTVVKDLPLTTASLVEIRYLNLVGDRYLAVQQGPEDAAGEPLEPGRTLPESQTRPALDLSALYNGFAPLFNALEPSQVNELSLNLVKVLQGEGGTIEGLVRETASLTTTIANRDKLIGDVITNLNQTLGTVDSRRSQVTELITELRRWVNGLAEDRVQIGRSVVNISNLTELLADFVTDARPVLKRDIAQLRRLAAVLSRDETRKVINQILTNLPEMLEDQTRTGTYGSWYNYYVCGYQADITLPRELVQALPALRPLSRRLRDITYTSDESRCDVE
jgi:phospholipid/cholesterol/gamma-HCH transport system substrate-binding protein